MKISSLNTITEKFIKVLKRFPFTMITAFIGTATAYSIVQFRVLEDEHYMYRLLMTTILGFLLFLVLELKIEREKILGKWNYIAKGLSAIFLILYYWQLPADFDHAAETFIIRFILLGLTLVFSFTFIPFIGHLKEVNGFWQYCKILFVRFFLTFIFTGALYLGLVLALLGVRQLLGIDFDERVFIEFWIVVVGLISTSFFLSGIPEKISSLQKKIDYNKGIRIFAEYILVPLILIYAIILYIYTGKIIIKWDWPTGMVSWLVIVFSVVTILANFMLHPLLKKEKFVRYFQKISYASIIPMSVVMFLSLKIRVGDYGVTEPRYYALVVCFWFLAISIYFIFSKKKNLLVIPISLAIITLVSSVGPLSSMNVSKYSQISRLKTVLTENNIFIDGKVQKAGEDLSREDAMEISQTLRYIHRMHGLEILQPWFDRDIEDIKSGECWGGGCILDEMGINLGSLRREDRRGYHVDESESFNIKGYTSIRPITVSNTRGKYRMGDTISRVSLDQDSMSIHYWEKEGSEELVIFLKEFIEQKLSEKNEDRRSRKEMRVDQGGAALVIDNFEIFLNEDSELGELRYLNGYLLIK